jgi:hypothetical protein
MEKEEPPYEFKVHLFKIGEERENPDKDFSQEDMELVKLLDEYEA